MSGGLKELSHTLTFPSFKSLGGEGSGNFGHQGIPGHQGGSGAGGEKEDEKTFTHGDRSSISAEAIKTVADVEEILRSKPPDKERAYSIDPKSGDVLATDIGKTGYSVGVPAKKPGLIQIHTHPSGEGFSAQDFLVAHKYDEAESRVVTSSGTYRLGPPPGGWWSAVREKDLKEAISKSGGAYNPHFDPIPIIKQFGLSYAFEPRVEIKSNSLKSISVNQEAE